MGICYPAPFIYTKHEGTLPGQCLYTICTVLHPTTFNGIFSEVFYTHISKTQNENAISFELRPQAH